MSMTSAIDAPVRRRARTPGKHIVAFVAGAVLVVGGAASILKSADYAAPASRRAADPLDPVRVGRVTYVPLEEFLVDLSPDYSGHVSYAKLAASISLSGPAAARAVERIEVLRPEINERLTFLLRNLRPEDFEGAEGMARVKAEMLRRVDLVIAPERADDVVISNLVIQ